MPQLPSGRYVEIMAERARFHARRLGLRITATTPHQQLYPLIDILATPADHHAGCRGCTTFTGHTLADRRWINQWQEADRSFFLKWLREESQVRVIEQARTRLLAENGTARAEVHPYPQRLYSVLQRRIGRLGLERADATQWRRTLLNMRRDGIRREELDWSGLFDFLSHREGGGPITKAELLAAIDFKPILPQLSNELESEEVVRLPLVEVARRLPVYQLQMAGYPVIEQDVAVVRYLCTSPHYRIGVIRPQGRSLLTDARPRWFVLGPYGRRVVEEQTGSVFFASPQAALAEADKHARRSHRLRTPMAYSRKYEYMSLHGGEAYREWLVTLPDYRRSHFTAHYLERNVLLHIRTKERVSSDGARVLFIEELQSDWQQAVARRGTRSGIPPAPFRKEWAGLALKLILMHAVEHGLDGIAWADAAVHEQRYDRTMGALRRLYDQELPGLLNRLGRPWGVKVERAEFATRSPWLHAARCNDCWKVEGGAGKFVTRPRYDKQQALALIERHSRALRMTLPILRLTAEMKAHIAVEGLPLFGETPCAPLPGMTNV